VLASFSLFAPSFHSYLPRLDFSSRCGRSHGHRSWGFLVFCLPKVDNDNNNNATPESTLARAPTFLQALWFFGFPFGTDFGHVFTLGEFIPEALLIPDPLYSSSVFAESTNARSHLDSTTITTTTPPNRQTPALRTPAPRPRNVSTSRPCGGQGAGHQTPGQ